MNRLPSTRPPASRRPRLVVTLGDPCGIGAELLLTSLQVLDRWGEVAVVGARAGVDLLAAAPGRPPALSWRWGSPLKSTPVPALPEGTAASCLWAGAGGEPGRALWLDPVPGTTPAQLRLGTGSAVSGRCAVEAVRVGAALVASGWGDALVTLPLAKSAAHQAGYPIPGHTEFLQQLCGSPISRMAFVSPSLSVVLHTVHQSLRSVVEGLEAEAVATTLAFAADRFMQLTGRSGLRVALCALNPHAGEGGAFGREEEVLDRALERVRAAFRGFDGSAASAPFAQVPSPFGLDPAPPGWSLFPGPDRRPQPLPSGRPEFHGPLPSDTLFQRAARGEFDLVVALYHDQGLIPIKVLEPDRAVNLTLGLPYIRTSPDHGTAFDRAGRWTADPANFLEAAALAVRLAGRAKGQPWSADAAVRGRAVTAPPGQPVGVEGGPGASSASGEPPSPGGARGRKVTAPPGPSVGVEGGPGASSASGEPPSPGGARGRKVTAPPGPSVGVEGGPGASSASGEPPSPGGARGRKVTAPPGPSVGVEGGPGASSASGEPPSPGGARGRKVTAPPGPSVGVEGGPGASSASGEPPSPGGARK